MIRWRVSANCALARTGGVSEGGCVPPILENLKLESSNSVHTFRGKFRLSRRLNTVLYCLTGSIKFCLWEKFLIQFCYHIKNHPFLEQNLSWFWLNFCKVSENIVYYSQHGGWLHRASAPMSNIGEDISKSPPSPIYAIDRIHPGLDIQYLLVQKMIMTDMAHHTKAAMSIIEFIDTRYIDYRISVNYVAGTDTRSQPRPRRSVHGLIYEQWWTWLVVIKMARNSS